MTMLALKWIAASVVFLTSIIAGLASLRLATQYQRFLAIGDAAANGIFLGIAIFHLFPEALHQLSYLGDLTAYPVVIGYIVATFLFMLGLDLLAKRKHKPHHATVVTTSLLILALTIHAFVAGAALGVTQTATLVSALMIALVAHKGFEVFALAISLMRYLHRNATLVVILLFACVTPLGILVGSLSETYLTISASNLASASFSAIAAGTFIYIGSTHGRHHPHPASDSFVQYSHFLTTLTGFALMGLLAIWL